jgi:hypothetical protein
MDVSRGRCLITPLMLSIEWTQAELSRRTGYDPKADLKDRVGYSQRMISFFAEYDGKGKGKPMSPEAMYMISRLIGVQMEALYEWIVIGGAE